MNFQFSNDMVPKYNEEIFLNNNLVKGGGAGRVKRE